jgi:hypothetical protein
MVCYCKKHSLPLMQMVLMFSKALSLVSWFKLLKHGLHSSWECIVVIIGQIYHYKHLWLELKGYFNTLPIFHYKKSWPLWPWKLVKKIPYPIWPKCHFGQVDFDIIFLIKGSWDILTNQNDQLSIWQVINWFIIVYDLIYALCHHYITSLKMTWHCMLQKVGR